MAKYIDADRLKAEIKRQIRLEELNFAALGGGGQTFCINTLEWVLKRIDSLQEEQPEVDLENEIRSMWEKCGPTDEGMGLESANIVNEQFDYIARHFYNLGLNARKEENK